MKEPWCLAASTTTESARTLIDYYAKRWGIESNSRDTNGCVPSCGAFAKCCSNIALSQKCSVSYEMRGWLKTPLRF